MQQFAAIDPSTATGETAAAFESAQAQFGAVINLFKTAAHAPNVLSGILALNAEVAKTTELDGKLIEQVAMLTSALNNCDYCVDVHMHVGQSMGLSREDLLLAMQGKASDAKAQALLNFTGQVVRNRGQASPESITQAREFGFSERALLETIGVIGVYTTLQYIRHVTKPDSDFPKVEEFDATRHGTPFSSAQT